MSVWGMGLGSECGVWSRGLRYGFADRVWAGEEDTTLRERCSGDLAAGLRVAFVLALLEAVALAVHLQDVHVVWVRRSSSASVSRSDPNTLVNS